MKDVFSLIALCFLPVPGMLLLKVIFGRLTLAAGYVSSLLLNLLVFGLCIKRMAIGYKRPDMMPVKLTAAILLVELAVFGAVWIRQSIKRKKWFEFKKVSFSPFSALACVIWIAGAVSYIRFVPEDAVTMMADINRIGFFGVTNGDLGVMLGYYLKSLLGISQADAVCLVVPLSFYVAFVVLMWEMANTLFQDKPPLVPRCFFALAVLTVLGDCLYTQPFMVLHGLNHVENVLTVLCVPFAFAICLRLYFSWDRFLRDKKKAAWSFGHIIALFICGCSAYFLYLRVFALVGLNLIIFVLLFMGRRYLPWLQSGKS